MRVQSVFVMTKEGGMGACVTEMFIHDLWWFHTNYTAIQAQYGGMWIAIRGQHIVAAGIDKVQELLKTREAKAGGIVFRYIEKRAALVG